MPINSASCTSWGSAFTIYIHHLLLVIPGPTFVRMTSRSTFSNFAKHQPQVHRFTFGAGGCSFVSLERCAAYTSGRLEHCSPIVLSFCSYWIPYHDPNRVNLRCYSTMQQREPIRKLHYQSQTNASRPQNSGDKIRQKDR